MRALIPARYRQMRETQDRGFLFVAIFRDWSAYYAVLYDNRARVRIQQHTRDWGLLVLLRHQYRDCSNEAAQSTSTQCRARADLGDSVSHHAYACNPDPHGIPPQATR